MNPKIIDKTSQIVWPWDKTAKLAKSNVFGGTSRLADLIPFGAGLGMAAIFYYLGHMLLFLVISAITIGIWVSAFMFPKIYQFFNQIFEFLGKWVGAILTWSLLTPFYYICFPTGRLVQMIRGRDPMKRQFPTSKSSYWEDHQSAQDINDYRRQF